MPIQFFAPLAGEGFMEFLTLVGIGIGGATALQSIDSKMASVTINNLKVDEGTKEDGLHVGNIVILNSNIKVSFGDMWDGGHGTFQFFANGEPLSEPKSFSQLDGEPGLSLDHQLKFYGTTTDPIAIKAETKVWGENDDPHIFELTRSVPWILFFAPYVGLPTIGYDIAEDFLDDDANPSDFKEILLNFKEPEKIEELDPEGLLEIDHGNDDLITAKGRNFSDFDIDLYYSWYVPWWRNVDFMTLPSGMAQSALDISMINRKNHFHPSSNPSIIYTTRFANILVTLRASVTDELGNSQSVTYSSGLRTADKGLEAKYRKTRCRRLTTVPEEVPSKPPPPKKKKYLMNWQLSDQYGRKIRYDGLLREVSGNEIPFSSDKDGKVSLEAELVGPIVQFIAHPADQNFRSIEKDLLLNEDLASQIENSVFKHSLRPKIAGNLFLKDHALLPGVTILLMDSRDELIERGITNEIGKFEFILPTRSWNNPSFSIQALLPGSNMLHYVDPVVSREVSFEETQSDARFSLIGEVYELEGGGNFWISGITGYYDQKLKKVIGNSGFKLSRYLDNEKIFQDLGSVVGQGGTFSINLPRGAHLIKISSPEGVTKIWPLQVGGDRKELILGKKLPKPILKKTSEGYIVSYPKKEMGNLNLAFVTDLESNYFLPMKSDLLVTDVEIRNAKSTKLAFNVGEAYGPLVSIATF